MKQKLSEFGFRKILLVIADAFIVIFSSLAAYFALSFSGRQIMARDMLIPLISGTLLSIVFLFAFGAYSKMWRYSRAKDYICCILGTVLGISVSGILDWISTGETVNGIFLLIQIIVATAGVCLFRVIFRSVFIGSVKKAGDCAERPRTMIIGGGRACKLLLQEMRNSAESKCGSGRTASPYDPVCIIDDDRNKVGSNVEGVEVVGTTADIKKFIDEKKIELIIFAIPSCLEEERKRILNIFS